LEETEKQILYFLEILAAIYGKSRVQDSTKYDCGEEGTLKAMFPMIFIIFHFTTIGKFYVREKMY
jgi:hypothetical protein